jgi:DNA recombination protein RmuC
VLAKVKSQTETVLKTLDNAQVRSRAMDRALRKVETLPDAQAQTLVAVDPAFDADPESGVSSPVLGDQASGRL